MARGKWGMVFSKEISSKSTQEPDAMNVEAADTRAEVNFSFRSRLIERKHSGGTTTRGFQHIQNKGKHIIIDVVGARIAPEDLKSTADRLIDAMVKAAKVAGARPVHQHLELFDGTVSPHGFAAVVMLDESHISAHCYSSDGLLAVDVFTCGSPEKTVVAANHLTEFLEREFPCSQASSFSVDRFPVQTIAKDGPSLPDVSLASLQQQGRWDQKRIEAEEMHGAVAHFMKLHFRHFNSAALVDAADGFVAHIRRGGRMVVTLAGAMSTAEIGISLAQLIRAGCVHHLSVTGANLEEDVFNLVANKSYKRIKEWRQLSDTDDFNLFQGGHNRVTDTCIPEEEAFRRVADVLLSVYKRAEKQQERLAPHELFYRMIREGSLEKHYEIDPKHSWLVAAAEMNIPIVTPGWEDSTCGNMIVSEKMKGNLATYPIKTGLEQMEDLVRWYIKEQQGSDIGFFQVGGGIAGDFPICAVPLIRNDMERDDVKLWKYFAQISDGKTSYGGYSAAPPNEKISWGKLSPGTPSFIIESDATIVFPLLAAYVLHHVGANL